MTGARRESARRQRKRVPPPASPEVAGSRPAAPVTAESTAEAAAFGEFYEATYRGLVAELYVYTGDLFEAQDAAQEAYLRAWTHWRHITTYEQPRAWVRRVGYHVAISRWRKARSALASWRRHGPAPAAPELDGVSRDLTVALRQLPPSQRRALVMHHMGGLAISEIAATEGVAEGTIKARLSRGRVALARLLAEDSREVPHDA